MSYPNSRAEEVEEMKRAMRLSQDGHGKNAAGAEAQKLERKPSEDINASADAFIRRFRQHLLIQRLESIENYEKMLARGL